MKHCHRFTKAVSIQTCFRSYLRRKMFYCRSTIDSIINQILGNVEDIAVDNMTNATVITSEDAIIDSIITDIVELATRRFSPTTPQSPDTNPVVSDLDFNEAHILSSGGSISMTSSTPSITGDCYCNIVAVVAVVADVFIITITITITITFQRFSLQSVTHR